MSKDKHIEHKITVYNYRMRRLREILERLKIPEKDKKFVLFEYERIINNIPDKGEEKK